MAQNPNTPQNTNSTLDIENIARYFKHAISFGVAIGFITIFTYFFFDIHWIPPTLSISDTASLLMIAIGIGIYVAIFTVFILPFSKIWLEIFNTQVINKKWKIFLSVLFFLIYIIIIYTPKYVQTYIRETNNPISSNVYYLTIVTIFTLAILSFLIALLAKVTRIANLSNNVIFTIILIIILLLILIFSTTSKENILLNLGIRKEKVIIQFKEDRDYNLVRREIGYSEFETKYGNDKLNLITDVNILWYGMGGYTLLQFNDCTQNKFTLPIKTDEIRIILPMKKTANSNKEDNLKKAEPKCRRPEDSNETASAPASPPPETPKLPDSTRVLE